MTATRLMRAALERRAVTFKNFHRPQPAAWMIGMQFKYVMELLPSMKLYKRKTTDPKSQ